MSYILIAFIYAGAFAKGDSVALESVPNFKTKASCEKAGNAMKDFVTATTKQYRFVCVEQ